MDPATASVAISVGAQALSSIAGSRAKKKARAKQRAMIKAALRELTPQQIQALATDLGVITGPQNAAAAAPQAEALSAQAQTFGLNAAPAIGNMQNQVGNLNAQNAFQNAMTLAPARANQHLGRAAGVTPNMNASNALGTVSQIANMFALFRGLR